MQSIIGIRNTTTVFDPSALDRVRPPRVVPYDGVLRSYDPQGALGQTWLRALNNGSYEKVRIDGECSYEEN